MDGLVFHLKRAWQSVLYRFCFRELEEFGLTPARFDMMTAVGKGVTQARLRELLGVSRAVVSRMLSALEELRLVVREKVGRTRMVTLTQSGVARLQRATEELVGDFGRVRTRLGAALDPTDASHDGAEARYELDCRLETLRKGMGDFAELAFDSQLDGVDWDG